MKKTIAVVLLLAAALLAFDFLAPAQAAKAGLGIERALAGLQARELSVDGYRVNYLEGGSGETLLLVHGFGADKDNFTKVTRHLTGQFRVIAIDLPGFGDSERLLQASYRIADQVTRLNSIAAALGLERFHLGGSSMGGQISASYAARYPQQVQSLWLLAPAGVAGAADSELFTAYRETGRSLLIAETPADFAGILDLTMSQPPFLPHSVKQVLAERAASDYSLHKRIFEEIKGSEPLNAQVAGLAVPTLIVWGEEDRALDVSGAPILQQLLAAAELQQMPDIGHLPMLEAPAETAARYLAFTAGL